VIAEELKKVKEDDGGSGKRKDAVGEDCPVYVHLFPRLSLINSILSPEYSLTLSPCIPHSPPLMVQSTGQLLI
jgi:hypothetical protein